MVKLTRKRIKWLVDQVVKKEQKPKDVASVYKLSTRRVQQLVAEFRETKKYPELTKKRRPKTSLTGEQELAIERAFLETKLNTRMLYFELKRRGFTIGKNKLYSFMKSKGWVRDEPRKKHRRKRCRYERSQSGSLVHGDWHRTSLNHPHCILWLDDASRKIVSGGEFNSPSSENAIFTFKQAQQHFAQYSWQIEQANTDRGPQFYNNHKNPDNLTDFQKHLLASNIKHIVSRRNNPQTNGKLERRWLEYDKHRWRFISLEEWIDWHNERLTTALAIEYYETPKTAFIAKLPNLFGLCWSRMENETKKTKK